MMWKKRACTAGVVLLCASMLLAASQSEQDKSVEKRPARSLADKADNQLTANPRNQDAIGEAVQAAPAPLPQVEPGSPAPRPIHVYQAPSDPLADLDAKAKALELRETLSAKEVAALYGLELEPSLTEVRPTLAPLGAQLRQGGEDCASATVIATLPATVTGTTTGWVDDYDESCPSASTSPDVVYSYTPASDVTVDINLCNGSTYDTKVYVYENDCTLPAIACDDDFCGSPTFQSTILGLDLFAGNTYYIVVDGWNGAAGDYVMEITGATPPPGCPADSLVSQAPSTPSDGWSFGVADTDFNLSGSVGGLQRWESFSGFASQQICGVTWWGIKAFNDGASFSQCSESPMAFTIEFYDDAAGAPGTLIATRTASLAGTPTGVLFSGFEMYEFTYDFTGDGCIPLVDGWVSIQGGGDSPTCWFLWASSGSAGDPGAEHLFDANDGLGQQADDYDLAMCLLGDVPPGACCDNAAGACVEGEEFFNCQGPDDRFLSGGVCGDFVPACGIALGACCDPATGTCSPDKPEAECDAQFGPGNWIAGASCTPNPCPQPPLSNDACVDATVVTDGAPAATGDNTDALPTDDDEASCQANSGHDLWYVYTATCTGVVTMDTEGSVMPDTVLSVYDACAGAEIACDDDDGTGLLSLLTFNAVAGTDYYVRVATYDGGTSPTYGQFNLNISCAAAPTGACCTDMGCEIVAQFQCEDAGGLYVGDGIACDPDPCAVGACCFDDGSCQVLSDMDCTMQGGTYQGGGTLCDPNPCPQPCPCNVTINTFPECEDWEAGLGDWTQATDDNLDWTRLSGPTGSSGTGPSGDHTTGSGFYVYLETSSPAAAGQTAVIESPCFDLSTLAAPELTFWYHMFGPTMGTLRCEVTADNCLTWDTVFELSGDQGNIWRLAAIDLADYAGDTIRIRFTGVVGSSFTGDMALDDICVGEAQVFLGGCCDLDTGDCLGFIEEATCLAMGNTTWSAGADCTVSNFCPQPPPANDLCADATVIDSLPFEDLNVNYGAATPDLDVTCNSSTCTETRFGVWYTYTPTENCTATVEQAATVFQDTIIAVFTGPDCNNLTQMVCSDPQIVSFDATAGVQYWILVGRWSCSSLPTGNIDIFFDCVNGACCAPDGSCTVDSPTACAAAGGVYVGDGVPCTPDPCSMGACCTTNGCVETDEMSCMSLGGNYQGNGTTCTPDPCPPLNDDCADAFPITDGTPAVEGTNANASAVDDAEVSCQSNSNKDVWYLYTATCTGTVTMDTEGSGQSDTVLAVFDACGGNEIACDDDDGTGLLSFLEFEAFAGQQYWVRMATFGTGAGGDFDINIVCTEAPQGACCSNGMCTIEYQSVCETVIGGVYGGDGTVCSGEDCNMNGSDDACEILENPALDCNENGALDECDISFGTSADLDGNGIPDECDPDCNTNGIPDGCDVSCEGGCAGVPGCGTSEDCQPDGIPDECQLGRPVRGDTQLFAQAGIPGDTGVGPAGLLAIGSSCPFNNTSADDFTLADAATITRITWQGVYFGAGGSDFPGMDSNFHVTIYEDNGAGNIGAVVADFPSVAFAKAPAARPPIFGTNPVYDYSADLPSGVAVDGGQRYWLSVNGDPAGASGPVFGWLASAEGNAADTPALDQPLQTDGIDCATLPAATMTAGGIDSDQDSDLAFALFGGAGGAGSDCNFNNIPDECDIAAGTAEDCDSNGVIDECEAGDCDANGVPDNCDLLFGAADCNANEILDKCEIAGGTAEDCNGDDVPDECQLDGNDCNNNSVPDDCDIASGFSQDCQPDGIPDECQLFPQPGGNIVADPSFEAGTPNPAWSEESTNFGTPLCDPNACNTSVGSGPHTGNWWVWFGGIAAFEAGAVEQTVNIPLGTTTLEFFFEIPTPSGNGTDFTQVLMDGNVLWTALENAPGFATYALVQVDISAFADGGNHLLRIESVISGTPGLSNFFVDDVTIVAPSGAPLNDCNQNGIPDDCELCGDLDGDDDVDVDDYNMFVSSFGRAQGHPDYLACADYDDSGAVGLTDYGAWLACYRDFVGNPLAQPPKRASIKRDNSKGQGFGLPTPTAPSGRRGVNPQGQ